MLPKSAITKDVEEFCKYPHDMDINMKLIAERARAKQPGMLVVDRWVVGEIRELPYPRTEHPGKAVVRSLGKLHHDGRRLGLGAE